MYLSPNLDRETKRESDVLSRHHKYTAAMFVLFCVIWSSSARCQTREEADFARPSLWAGGEVSGSNVEYGDRKMWGGAAFVDADTTYHLGIEAEGRWLEFHQTANVHLETYMIGPRYHRDFGKLQPFVKATIGFGNFNFPYNFATGRYLVVGAGGGVDVKFGNRWRARLVEVQYQNWPNFTYGAMNVIGLSSGIRFRVF